MVGKARSSNFTLSEKLDVLELVKPYVKVLEEHTNKHSVIVEKNRCWDIITEQYNALGKDRPARTAQGLRTLYKRLKEGARQELMQRKQAQPEHQGSLSEPTKTLMEIVPLFPGNVQGEVRNGTQERISTELDFSVNQPANSSCQISALDCQHACVTVELEEDIKPPLSLNVITQPSEIVEQIENVETKLDVHSDNLSSPSSGNVQMISSSPVPTPRGSYLRLQTEQSLGEAHEHSEQVLVMAKEEHEIIMENQRKLSLYIEEKREGQKRKQRLEEELLRVKIKVEKLKVVRLRHGLPECNNV
ncbi:fibrinogen silencer-binding protein [Latimeria chalumnae]|uniref:fibrinogen silencer-binding protein n=1 Tax=Latimeria chalumnae TaxID=7897 RepID=UPI0003C17E29|nr:PREDICTED: fibrinogen silencer-binding protein-like [Latimeria chalumnae]|eukprot:XP_006003498.1 PREDICTED: fibrinogen silencer-binding protein-like [Latimeria chalumnae]